MDDGSNASINVYPSIEAIEEVEVLTSNYGAQYGRNSSGTIEVETKSGTNQFHGGLYEFVRNDVFNARNFFDLTDSAPPYKKNDFGYDVGGPIWKNHTFFFWSEECERRTSLKLSAAPRHRPPTAVETSTTFATLRTLPTARTTPIRAFPSLTINCLPLTQTARRFLG